MAAAQKSSERRPEHMMVEILEAQGWDLRRPPSGDVLRQQEYRAHPHLLDLFKGRSKTGPGSGIPEALLVDRVTLAPLAVIEAKADIAGLDQAIAEATRFYGNACVAAGYSTVAIALAGASEDAFALRVLKWNGQRWVFVTYDG